MNLHEAARKNLVDEVKNLLARGADINEVSETGYTALHHSIAEKSIEVLIFLLNQNANVTIGDDRGETALHYAVYDDMYDVVEMMLQKDKSIINLTDDYGNEPLWTAVLKPKINYSMIKLLLEYGGDINHKNSSGVTPLDMAHRKNDQTLLKMFSPS